MAFALQVAARQRMHVEMDDDSLSRAFQGGVTLTFREEETITLDPAQVFLLPKAFLPGDVIMHLAKVKE